MSSYKISYERPIGWIIEIRGQGDLDDRQAIVLENQDDVLEFFEELGHAYQNSLSDDWSF